MTEQEWLESKDPRVMLRWLMGHGRYIDSESGLMARCADVPSNRKLRLYACACCRLSGTKNDVVDEYEINGSPRFEELEERRRSDLDWALMWTEKGRNNPPLEVRASLIRDIFGNPFKVTPIKRYNWQIYCDPRPCKPYPKTMVVDAVIENHAWRLCNWLTPTVLRLAYSIYTEGKNVCWTCKGTGLDPIDGVNKYPCITYRGTGRSNDGTIDPFAMFLLADALEEAGCEDHAILSHLRTDVLHVRGCWVLDLIGGLE